MFCEQHAFNMQVPIFHSWPRLNSMRYFSSIKPILIALVLLPIPFASADMCGRGPRTLFTLQENVTKTVFNSRLQTLRQQGYQIVAAMAGLKMIVGCRPKDLEESPTSTASETSSKHTQPDVIAMETDRVIQTAGAGSSWALDRIDQPNLPLDRYDFDPRNCSSRLGADVDVYIIDTGCRSTHQAFLGRMIHSEASPGSGYKQSGPDDNGHGTAVASLVVGRETGAAAGANVTCIKALNRSGTGRFSDVISGLNLAVERRKKRGSGRGTFAVLSLTAEAGKRYLALDEAVGRAAKKGVVTFAAAGNEGRDACKFTPGRSSAAVAVGAVDEKDRLAKFSNRGLCVDAVGPGRRVLVADGRGDEAFRKESGTSFSTPLVAAVVALKWETGEGRQTEIAKRLLRGMREVGGAGYRMPTLDGRCHGRRYSRGEWVVMGVAWGAIAVGVVGGLVGMAWRWG